MLVISKSFVESDFQTSITCYYLFSFSWMKLLWFQPMRQRVIECHLTISVVLVWPFGPSTNSNCKYKVINLCEIFIDNYCLNIYLCSSKSKKIQWEEAEGRVTASCKCKEEEGFIWAISEPRAV